MAGHFRVVRGEGSAATPLVVASLLIAAALMACVGQIKSTSIERAYRHTQYAAASVVSVSANRVAKVRYLWAGKPRTGQVDVSTAAGVDQGDRLGVRVSEGGRRLQLETQFYGAVYLGTAITLTLVALLIAMVSWRSPEMASWRGKHWLPAELRRPLRRYRG